MNREMYPPNLGMTASTVRDKSITEMQIDELQGATMELMKTIERLTDRLTPVLERALPPEKMDPTEPARDMPAVPSSIRSGASAVRIASAKLADIIDRLAV